MDFILPFWGAGVRPICDAHDDLIVVEPGIGYAEGFWAKWKIFESYALYHANCGTVAAGVCQQNWYETVIPNYFDSDDFDFCPEKKEDYFLFVGRVYEGKGIQIAIQLTEKLGVKLLVCGQGSLKENGYTTTPAHVTEIGYIEKNERKRIMSRAKCGIVASLYLEPFGGVQIEMLMSGTPTITTDWGAFTENNIHGVTGYRCRTFNDFLCAGRNIDKINPSICRAFAMNNFSCEVIALKYEKYFQDVLNVYTGNGWYEESDDVTFNNLALANRSRLIQLQTQTQPCVKNLGDLSSLYDIFKKYKSDKIPEFSEHNHTYYSYYQKIFEHIRDKPITLFEMGIGSINQEIKSNMFDYNQTCGYEPGSSLKTWAEYFYNENTKIIGGDIDPSTCNLNYGPKIKTFEINQMDSNALEDLLTKNNFSFDIIIDDGLHTVEAAKSMLLGAWETLKIGGYYIIEDLVLDNETVDFFNFSSDIKKEIWYEPKSNGKVENNYLLILKKNCSLDELFVK